MEALINERLSKLNPEYRLFVEGDFVEVTAETLGKYNNFSERQKEILENAITLYLLFFLDDPGAIMFIGTNCELDRSSAKDLFSAVKLSLPEGMEEMLSVGFSIVNSGDNFSIADEIAETEKEFESLHGIRTMAGDMQAVQSSASVPTYQSSQSDLIRPTSAPAYPPPAPSMESDSRWEA